MIKTSLLVVLASTGLLLLTSNANSMTLPDDGDGGSTPTTHPIDPGTTDKPGTPDLPGKPGNHHASDEPMPDPAVVASLAEKVCNRALGTLRGVTKTEVLQFTYEPGVLIRPVCEGSAAMKSTAIDNTQAAPVQGAISKNPSMTGPLSIRGYEANDVVGIEVKDQVAVLYVHRSGI